MIVTELEKEILVSMAQHYRNTGTRCVLVTVSPETMNEIRRNWKPGSFFRPRMLSHETDTFSAVRIVESMTVRGFKVE